MSIRAGDDELANELNNTVPTSSLPVRDPDTEPQQLPELWWRGLQRWICGIVAVWPDAPGWYVIDWGDGHSSIAHPQLRPQRHALSTHSACDNITSTVTARVLHRDGTTGPVQAQSVVQARGWGAPQHEFVTFESNPNRVFARLFTREKPLGYGLAWDPDTAIEQLPEDGWTADYTYPAGPARQPLIGVLDRPARRLRWFSGPMINKNRKFQGGGGQMLVAKYETKSKQWNSYTGEYTVTNNSKSPSGQWILEFTVAKPAAVADFWPNTCTLKQKASTNTTTTYQITSAQGLAGGEAIAVGFRMEPGKKQGGENEPILEPTDCKLNGQPCGGKPDGDPPGPVTDLKVTGTSHKSIDLSWTAATDNVGVARYDVDLQPAPKTGKTNPFLGSATSGTVTGLAPETEYTIKLRAVDYADNRGPWSDAVRAATGKQPPEPEGWGVGHAPYVDMAGWPTPQLHSYGKESNANGFSLAFVVAAGVSEDKKLDPMPSWGGYKSSYGITHTWDTSQKKYVPLDKPFQHENITSWAKDHHVVISFGGAGSLEIAQCTKDVEETYTIYKSVIDAYAPVKRYDFDIEGSAQQDADANKRRATALAKLQHEDPSLLFSLTLPVNPDGLTQYGLDVLHSMLDAGVQLSLVNIMAMEFGSAYPGDMGDLTVAAADATAIQLDRAFGYIGEADQVTEATAKSYQRLGVCPMLGANINGRKWTLAHAKQLLEHANAKGIGSLTHWEATRDKNACFGDTYKCTSVPQSEWEFTQKYFSVYAGPAAPVPPAKKSTGKRAAEQPGKPEGDPE